MGNRARQLTWPGNLESVSHPISPAWGSKADSNSLHKGEATYEPPFGLSPLMRRVLIALGLIDGYIEGLDEFRALNRKEDGTFEISLRRKAGVTR